MFLKFSRLTFRPQIVFDVPVEGAEPVVAGGPVATPELPESLKGKYIPVDQHNGTVGSWKKKATTAETLAATTAGERDALQTQLNELTTRSTAWQTAAGELEGTKTKLGETEKTVAQQQAANARLKALLKHPEILDDSTLALVESSSLELPALEEHLGKLAALVGKGAEGRVTAASPAKQQSAEAKPEDYRDEAMKLMAAGDTRGYNVQMNLYWAALDKTKGKFAPPEPRLPGDAPAGPGG
jgi:hypothetical protein